MNKMYLAYLGALLLLHLLSSQVVQAQADNTTSTTKPTLSVNKNVTTASNQNSCGTTDAFTLLLPLAAAFSLLFWS